MAPKAAVKIPAHVFGYSLALVPAVMYGYYYQTNKKEDADFEAELRKNYSHNIDSSVRKRQQMVNFMDALKKGEGDKRLDEVLQGGKGDMKRLYPVDEKLYGTQEGIETKKRMEAELASKKRKRKKKAVASVDAKVDQQSEGTSISAASKSVLGLTLIAAGALAAHVFLGGGRRQ